ncbi:hypothetical protein F5144DRAFT_660792 [Chaetomium tenue]|uniref:Uncharacterized protein n=1 Tax=Chaetomium tenue TaxID=1854479 RepID=A0ACB7NVN8_9PEZI|nr:hypothetical protein F5144DRAFT_660792 [Chaetomium globosum]
MRVKYVADISRGRSKPSLIQEPKSPHTFEIAKASTPKELVPVHPWFCETLPGVHDSMSATFLIQPQDTVQIAAKFRSFVVTVTNPPGRVPGSLPRYKATVSIFYNNSGIRVADPSPVVEHIDRQIPNTDTAGNMHFLFDSVKVDYVGEFTMHASIFRPDDDLNGPAFLTTPWSTAVKVLPPGRRIKAIPPTAHECLVLADLGIKIDLDRASSSRAETTPRN